MELSEFSKLVSKVVGDLKTTMADLIVDTGALSKSLSSDRYVSSYKYEHDTIFHRDSHPFQLISTQKHERVEQLEKNEESEEIQKEEEKTQEKIGEEHKIPLRTQPLKPLPISVTAIKVDE